VWIPELLREVPGASCACMHMHNPHEAEPGDVPGVSPMTGVQVPLHVTVLGVHEMTNCGILKCV
jgi:hypothetical protein